MGGGFREIKLLANEMFYFAKLDVVDNETFTKYKQFKKNCKSQK